MRIERKNYGEGELREFADKLRQAPKLFTLTADQAAMVARDVNQRGKEKAWAELDSWLEKCEDGSAVQIVIRTINTYASSGERECSICVDDLFAPELSTSTRLEIFTKLFSMLEMVGYIIDGHFMCKTVNISWGNAK